MWFDNYMLQLLLSLLLVLLLLLFPRLMLLVHLPSFLSISAPPRRATARRSCTRRSRAGTEPDALHATTPDRSNPSPSARRTPPSPGTRRPGPPVDLSRVSFQVVNLDIFHSFSKRPTLLSLLWVLGSSNKGCSILFLQMDFKPRTVTTTKLARLRTFRKWFTARTGSSNRNSHNINNSNINSNPIREVFFTKIIF